MALSHILDPISDNLEPDIWLNPKSSRPTLKPQLREWILYKLHQTLNEDNLGALYQRMQIVLTGSLTTYQYSPDSDVDISLFIPNDDILRAKLISLFITHLDGVHLPGTTHPLQIYVVPHGISPEKLYQPHLRAGYDVKAEKWIVPPDKASIYDVEKEQNGFYIQALMIADKMEHMLKHDPQQAINLWHQIHFHRRRDMSNGKPNNSYWNIVMKFLQKRGLFPSISEVSGEYIP